MRRIIVFVAVTFLSAAGAFAQNADDAFEQFKRARLQEQQDFERRRAEELAEFKARYYDAFERFKQLYRSFLEDEENVVDLMASDDGIRISSVNLAAQPKVVTTASDQKKILAENIRKIQSMRPEELVPVLSDKPDSVERMKEAAETLEEIVTDMETVAVEDDDPPVEVTVDVVLEPVSEPESEAVPEPEPVVAEPAVKDTAVVEPAAVEPVEEPAACDSVVVESAEEPVVEEPVTESVSEESSAGETDVEESVVDEPSEPEAKTMDSSIPQGKPTEYVRISSPFGTRVHPITHKTHTHKGVDLAAPRMTPIYATADGTVTYSGRNGGYGKFVKINHRNGYKTAYAHMQRIPFRIRKGVDVRKGDLIGYVGSTGASTGNHLHYEIYYQDKLVDPATTL
ncbi:MAG TPA: peptidoglycan DD-metalloendopeptidase family protein [Candidatus Coprenecus stercoravium]|uniref:Peptidoglycan DD-metalloendopeptidase family protein n=1 Tax=Candidatus Coprenecus stercoravium TaxID=2840735 RepID=A0A9D2KAU5_9BACT|nr:peptidoglycan DD-metalloendopeptidase family protein [Candidatus Coprenecus stercoravium]